MKKNIVIFLLTATLLGAVQKVSLAFPPKSITSSGKVNPVRDRSPLGGRRLSSSLISNGVKILSVKDYIINPLTYEYIRRGLKKAEGENAVFILKLDTPGGLLKSTQGIVKLFLNASVPIITYITPKGARAASAGVFISYASNIIAMSPSTHIGAAHPVIGGGSWGNLSKEVKEKILNDTLAWAKTIAEERGRPLNFIQDAVKKSISITAKEALNKKICNLIADDLNDLLNKINGKTVTTKKGEITIKIKKPDIENVPLTLREEILNTLINPNIAYLLFTLGFLGLIIEITHPGLGLPGIAGTICLLLAFYAFSILPLNYAGLSLIILGIIFLIIESFTPTFGMFTLGGIIALFFGSLMLFNQPLSIRVSFKVFVPVIVSISAILLFVAGKAISAQRRKSRVGKEGLMGKEGVALIAVHKKGKVRVHGEIWNALSKEHINKNDKIIVEGISGLILHVTKKEEV